MKLPNVDSAVVDQEKITGYLLDPAHRYGASKARFFAQFGFRLAEWEILANALRAHAGQHEIARSKESGYGRRYEIDGPLDTPDGKRPRVRSVWQTDEGQLAPRLITAHPLEP